jgi:hypothetical protein
VPRELGRVKHSLTTLTAAATLGRMAIEKQIGFRCPDDLRDWMQAQADAADRKLSDWIRKHFEAERAARGTSRRRALDNAKRRA